MVTVTSLLRQPAGSGETWLVTGSDLEQVENRTRHLLRQPARRDEAWVVTGGDQ